MQEQAKRHNDIGLTLMLLVLISITFISCNGNSSPRDETTEPVVTATNTPTKDETGNEYNPDGWTLPQPLAKAKQKSKKEAQYQDGRKVKVDVVSYAASIEKQHRTIISGPYYPGGKAGVVTSVEELSVGGGRVFCYIYDFSPFEDEGLGDEMAVTSKYKFCDMDGDGKYELRGDGLRRVIVPDWAK